MQHMQARGQLGTPGAAKSFLRGAQIFKLCPVVLTYAQHIFPEGEKNFAGGFLVTSLNICFNSNLQKGNSNAGKYSIY